MAAAVPRQGLAPIDVLQPLRDCTLHAPLGLIVARVPPFVRETCKIYSGFCRNDAHKKISIC